MSALVPKKDIVCLDTHILIWGIKGECEEGQENRVEQAKIFLNTLEKDEGIEVHISSIVLGELLASKDGDNLDSFFNDIFQLISIDPFEAQAAYHFSKIWNHNKKGGTYKSLREKKVKREKIKIDQFIVASSLAVGAKCIYSHDGDIKAIADGFIEVREMPRLEIQDDMQTKWES